MNKNIKKFEVGKEYGIYRYTRDPRNLDRIKLPYTAKCLYISEPDKYGEKKARFMVGKKKMEYTISKEIYPDPKLNREIACHVAASVNPLAVEHMVGGTIRADDELQLTKKFDFDKEYFLDIHTEETINSHEKYSEEFGKRQQSRDNKKTARSQKAR